jgi:hypothetical protein
MAAPNHPPTCHLRSFPIPEPECPFLTLPTPTPTHPLPLPLPSPLRMGRSSWGLMPGRAAHRRVRRSAVEAGQGKRDSLSAGQSDDVPSRGVQTLDPGCLRGGGVATGCVVYGPGAAGSGGRRPAGRFTAPPPRRAERGLDLSTGKFGNRRRSSARPSTVLRWPCSWAALIGRLAYASMGKGCDSLAVLDERRTDHRCPSEPFDGVADRVALRCEPRKALTKDWPCCLNECPQRRLIVPVYCIGLAAHDRHRIGQTPISMSGRWLCAGPRLSRRPHCRDRRSNAIAELGNARVGHCHYVTMGLDRVSGLMRHTRTLGEHTY